MQIPEEIIERLLKGEHLNIEERERWGISFSNKLKFKDLTEILEKILKSRKSFPIEFSSNNEMNREGVTIFKKSEGEFIGIICRNDLIHPEINVERTERKFTAVKEAAEFYLRWELSLPGSLDSIRVE